MKKMVISAFIAFALFASFIGTFVLMPACVTADADKAWENVFKEDFEDGDWEDYFTEVDSGLRTVPGQVDYTNAIGEELGTIKRIASRIGTTRTLALNETASPFYAGNAYAGKGEIVRISFDLAKEATDRTANIKLVGSSGGTTVSTGTSAGNRFVFANTKIFAHDSDETSSGTQRHQLRSFSASKWFKIVVDINCITDSYDIYIYDGGDYDGLYGTNLKLDIDFDEIYGISVEATAGGDTTRKATYVDNIEYYIPKDSISLSTDFEYDEDVFRYTLNADGNTSSDSAYMLVAIYNPNKELLYTKIGKYNGYSDNMSDSVEVENAKYLKGFVWDMNSFEPFGDCKTYDIVEDNLSAEIMKSKNGADATIVFVHDDGAVNTATYLIPEFEKNNLSGTVALMGIKAVEQEDINTWTGILADSHGRLNLASHSYYHDYMGLSDEEHTVYFDGEPSTYPAGYMTQTIANERARLNGLFPNERILTFVKPGTGTPDGEEQVSEAAKAMIRAHYIAMRNTGKGVDKIPPNDVYSVNSLMARVGECELGSWQSNLTKAINQKGLLVYLFHAISNKASGLTSSKSDVSVLLADMGEKVAQGKIWSAKFDEAMQYAQEYGANAQATAKAYYKDRYIAVSVTDEISRLDTDLSGTFANREMFDYPLTVKVAVPFNWTYVKLTQNYYDRVEVAKTFIENGVRYVYANVVPDQATAILTEASSSDYVSGIFADGAAISGFNPAKFYNKVELPSGTTAAPTITCDKPSAIITQATLTNGEGSGFVTYNGLTYEIHFSVK